MADLHNQGAIPAPVPPAPIGEGATAEQRDAYEQRLTQYNMAVINYTQALLGRHQQTEQTNTATPIQIKTDIEKRDEMDSLMDIVTAAANSPWVTTYTEEQAKKIYKQSDRYVDGYPYLDPKFKAALEAKTNEAKALHTRWNDSNNTMKGQAHTFNALADIALRTQQLQEAARNGVVNEQLWQDLTDTVVNALHINAINMSKQAAHSRDLVRKAQGMKPADKPGKGASSAYTYMTATDEAEADMLQHRELVTGRFTYASSSTSSSSYTGRGSGRGDRRRGRGGHQYRRGRGRQ
tara:strand:+ start:166 stop:1044 length:879 start_codon:yes stop_codon:yes gene_type:complete